MSFMLIHLNHKLGEDKGAALFSTVLLVLFVFTVAIAILELTSMENRISYNQQQAAKALYLAEAGIQLAIHRLEHDPQWKTGYRNYQIGDGVIKEVVVDNRLNSVRIESLGEVEGVQRRISAELAKIRVPFTYPLITNQLVLRPGANLTIEGDALHFGDFFLTNPGALEGFLIVDGTVQLGKGVFRGTVSATGSISVHEEAQVTARLVSSQEIDILGEPWESIETHSSVPILVQNISTIPDFSWYYHQPNFLLEEPVLFVEELFSGIFIAAEDLTIMTDEPDSAIPGQTAVVVPGTAIITCNLVPNDPMNQSLLIVAENIIIMPGVTRIWAALLATGSIQVMGGSATREFYGTLQAPLITLPPGTTKLTYYPLAGNHLVSNPQVLFQVTAWNELMLR